MLGRILNIIGWFGTALVVASVVVFFARPEWNRYAVYLAWTGLVLVLLYPLANWRDFASQFSRRQSRYAAVASTSVLVVLGILVAVNYLSTRNSKRWDLTANSVNSLSEQSIKVVSELTSPVKLILVDQKANFDRYRNRMTIYDAASSQLSVEYVDAEGDPVRAKTLGIETIPTLIVEYMGRTDKVTTLEEREITSAIIRVVTGEQRKMYFVQGHGEKDPAGAQAGTSYSEVASLLKGDNVAVETLQLLQHTEVPADASLVAIVGPETDYLEEEIARLEGYLARGGKLLLMLDPAVGAQTQGQPRLTALASAWGITVANDVVLDVSGLTQNPSIAVASVPYPTHPITSTFRVISIYPISRSLSAVSPAPEGRTVQPVIQTSDAAWAETDLKGLMANQNPSMDAASGDKAGPLTIAMTSTTAAPEAPDPAKPEEKPATPQTRVAVFGDSDFASNAYGGNAGNADMFVNTVNWLTAQENLISIRPREPRDSRLDVTPPVLRMLGIVSLLVLPALVLGAGIVNWSRRRRS
jgi:ABC-type uncharacterized transport system involved in gliding motility auxiliary subunit